ATKDYSRQLPQALHSVGRLPISAKLYLVPPQPPPKRRGAPRKKGNLIGSPKTLAQTATGWAPPQRSRRRDPSLGWPVAPGVAWAPRAGRGAATAWCTHSQTARTKTIAPSHRSLFLHCSDLERGRGRARVWPPLGRGNCHP